MTNFERSVDMRCGEVSRSWRCIGFIGLAPIISVGHILPVNWATDLEGSARFDYQLLCALLVSNVLAVLLQTLAPRLAIVGRLDLAKAVESEQREAWYAYGRVDALTLSLQWTAWVSLRLKRPVLEREAG